jgi:aldehyde dehydrogenase (NAD+)
MNALKLGNPLEPGTQMGPQADRKQAEAITKYLEIGSTEGVALTGGKPATDKGDNFIQPTIFTGLADTSMLSVEEIFGPVLVLHEFETEDEAVRRANDTECK